MKLLSSVGAVALASLLAACAAEPVASANPNATAPAAPAAAGGDEMVCSREYPIGSNIPVTKCRSRAQIDAERAASQEALKRSQTVGPNPKMGGGG